MITCKNLEEVRNHIDGIDNQIVKLIAERSHYVQQESKFKKSSDDVKAPKRVEAVIEKVRKLADENEVSSDIIEQIYRTMISAFIEFELSEHKKINNNQYVNGQY